MGGIQLNQPIVGMAATPTATATGSSPATAASSPSATRGSSARPERCTSTSRSSAWRATPNGKGYWLVASDGGVFSFGDARFFGSTGAIRLNQPIVGMAADARRHRLLVVAGDGGVFSFGDAAFKGSTGNIALAQPVVGIAADPDGSGYWMAARDGGLFAFDAKFNGSNGATPFPSARRGPPSPSW